MKARGLSEAKTLGVAVVGLGVGESHARTYAALPGCEVRWLLDLQPGRAEAVAQDLGRGRVAADFAQVFEIEAKFNELIGSLVAKEAA